jgi:hypothetical protein
MRQPRLTLSSLMGIVGVLALGMGGLASSTRIWTSAAATLTLFLLLSAALGGFLRSGHERAICTGFAIFGGAYLFLVNWDWVGAQFGHDLTAGLGDLADSLIPRLPYPLAAPAAGQGAMVPLGPSEMLAARQVRIGNFLQISRMLLALLFGLAGGWVGGFLSRRSAPERDR